MGKVAFDATMMLKWRSLEPVGIVRLERILAAAIGNTYQDVAVFVRFHRGAYWEVLEEDVVWIRSLGGNESAVEPPEQTELAPSEGSQRTARTLLARRYIRRSFLDLAVRSPPELSPHLANAAMSMATLLVESSRWARRELKQKKIDPGVSQPDVPRGSPLANLDVSDLVIVGLGWEYLDYEYLYSLKTTANVRLHIAAFDLIPVLHPELNPFQAHIVHRHYAEMSHFAHQIISISNATQYALENFFDSEELAAPKLFVNPLPSFISPDDSMREAYNGVEPFVLFVSTIEIRKNHILLLKIWLDCLSSGRSMPRLVFVGRRGWLVEDVFDYVENNPLLADAVDIVHDLNDRELQILYTTCLFTVFPSRSEGWGLPITEAMALGKVCLHADDPAQKEASQGLMPVLHPDDYIGWRAALLELIDNEGHRQNLEATIARDFHAIKPAIYGARFISLIEEARSA